MRLARIIDDVKAVALVEFALLAPVLILFMASLIDLGIAYNAQLKLVSATAAAAQYAFANGQTLSATTASTYMSQIATVASTAANISPAPTVSVLLNNAANGANVGNYYCVTGSSPTLLTYVSTGTVSASCGGNVTSGKFVVISMSTTTATVIVPESISSYVIPETDAAVVRIQ